MTVMPAPITNTMVTTKAYDAANWLITVTTEGAVRTLEWNNAGELPRDGDPSTGSGRAYAWDAAHHQRQTGPPGAPQGYVLQHLRRPYAPYNLGLDHRSGDQWGGSKAIYDFLLEHQPALSLHGHIHDSPKVSGRWHARLGDTLCIQPG